MNLKNIMNKAILLIISVFFLFSGCSKDDDEEPQGTDITEKLVINELMPTNSTVVADQDGEYDDWIELYNLSEEDIDISRFYLSDKKDDLTRWQFPAGTVIRKKGYLIIWADGDSTTQAGLHTNYKLSAEDGENVVLLTPEQQLIDLVEFPPTLIEQSYARVPNGTGDFQWTTPTFNAVND